MPTFDFTSPEGKVYSVEGPEGATQAQAFEILQAQIGGAQTPTPSAGVGEDLVGVAKAAPGRLVGGLAGIPGDLLHLGMRALGDNLTPESNYGSHAIAKSLGSDYEAKTEPGRIAQKAIDFAPAMIGGPETLAVKALTRVAAPVAASEAGKAVAGPYGELGGALLGAGGATAATRKFQEMAAARRTGLAVPTGEQLLETGSNQFNQARNMDVVVKPDFAQRTAADMRTALKDFDPEDASVKDVFRKIDRLGKIGETPETVLSAAVKVDGQTFTGQTHAEALQDASKKLKIPFDDLFGSKPGQPGLITADDGFITSAGRYVDRNEASKIADKASQIRAGGSVSQPLDTFHLKGSVWDTNPSAPPVYGAQMNEIENVRKQLSKLRMSPDASTREAAKKAQEVLTKNQMALTAADTISGDSPLYSKTMQEAVGNYAAGKRSAIVTGKQDLAELNTGTAGSGANADNNLRQAMKQLARPINNTNVPVAKRLGFNDPEIAAIKGAATGTGLGNTARYLGKLAPTGSVSGVLSGGAGFAAAGPVGAIGFPAAGYIAKKIGDLSTKRAVVAVDSLVRSRSPMAAQVAAQLPPQVIQQLPAKTQQLLQGLILADPILSQQTRQPIGQPAA